MMGKIDAEQSGILANTVVGISRLKDRRFIWVNERIEEIFGYSSEELIGQTTQNLYGDGEAYRETGESAYPAIAQGKIFDREVELSRKDGEKIWCRLMGRAIDKDADDTIWVIDDVTERKLTEQALKRSEERFRTLVESINEWVWEVDSEGVYRFSNSAPQRLLGYSPEEVVGRTLYDLMPPAESHRVRELFSRYVERKNAFTGLENVIRHKDGHEVILEMSGVPILDDSGKITGFRGIGRDVTGRVHAERLQRDQEESLRRGLVSTIDAMGRMIEARDPYTSGHQNRVARIVRGIGVRLGLNENTLRELEMGAMIHDIGKIAIPSEILTRPGRFSEEEYALVKTHAVTGYDIVKGSGLPWPVPFMVLQHHERLDGSGYPQGLKGREIFMESRILAVADVVEAMSVHRPYRPALGIEAGLTEIDAQKGRLYDSDVVDACLAMIREEGFAFLDSVPAVLGAGLVNAVWNADHHV